MAASRLLPADAPALGVLSFGLAGLGCSALLPLTISFGQDELTAISASLAGGVIAFYQLGYGIAAFGVGPLQNAGVDLADDPSASPPSWPRAMGLLSFLVARTAARARRCIRDRIPEPSRPPPTKEPRR